MNRRKEWKCGFSDRRALSIKSFGTVLNPVWKAFPESGGALRIPLAFLKKLDQSVSDSYPISLTAMNGLDT